MDGLVWSSFPHAWVWPSDTGKFEDMKRCMLERKGHNVFDSIKEVAVFASWDADVMREPFCNDDPNAAKQLTSFPV